MAPSPPSGSFSTNQVQQLITYLDSQLHHRAIDPPKLQSATDPSILTSMVVHLTSESTSSHAQPTPSPSSVNHVHALSPIQSISCPHRVLEINGTWSILSLPPGKHPVGCKWVYKIKFRADGTVKQHKARLVAKGNTQQKLIWPDGAFLGGHVSIPDWLSWNQNSVFEGQSETDTWQGGICKSSRGFHEASGRGFVELGAANCEREKRKKRNQEDRDLRRLLVRELRRGKLAGLVDIGGGLEAFTAEQSFTGKGFSQATYCLLKYNPAVISLMTHEVKPLKITLTRFLLCSILSGFFFLWPLFVSMPCSMQRLQKGISRSGCALPQRSIMVERNVLGFEGYFAEVVLVEEANKQKTSREETCLSREGRRTLDMKNCGQLDKRSVGKCPDAWSSKMLGTFFLET
ncbi:hypothetical protein CK203_091908 [Vitis vinifera]|uniref:Reverse transcriptase Ty1/copia-type domain-containing protein n=1 Tax=Vitis vinifera TaxID=29760 RepID=A0A438BRK3_VITVI|nr:hypothetical protein CK203_091908 [Vitis vinifera]